MAFLLLDSHELLMIHHIFALLALALIGGCTSIPDYAVRRYTADSLAQARKWEALRVETQKLPLIAYVPTHIQSNEILALYIEGDGFSWITSSLPSSDPTPIEPVGLKLALAHPDGNAAYLARPCQYIDARELPCSSSLWLGARFSETAVTASNQAIDALKKRFGAKKLVLVGYSGGGAIATLVAARRSDVIQLVTVAGNLDHRSWTLHHRVSPLSESLNPIDFGSQLVGLHQVHLIGNDDQNIRPEFVTGFVVRNSASQLSRVVIVPGFDHHCCWTRDWKQIWRSHVLPM